MVNVGQTSIRRWVRRFAKAMERQLRENDWKGDFQDMTFDDLLARIDEELDELRDAIALGRPGHVIAKEAADVANFVGVIARLAREPTAGAGDVDGANNPRGQRPA